MKNIILAFSFLFIGTHLSQAQLDFGIKAGINYNSNSIKEVSDNVIFSNAESKTGFHAGIWLQGKLPIIGLFIRPELVYTKLSNSVNYQSGTLSPITTTYDFQKIDIPILIGKKIFKVGRIFAGPSFQYILDGDFSIDDISDVEADGFTVGLQLGAGVDIGSLGLDVRWERGFSDTESSLISDNISDSSNFDTRVNQIIIGLSYKF